MHVLRQRLALTSLVAAAYAVSCAVFPDEAVLPGGNGSGAGGEVNAGAAADGGVAEAGSGPSDGGGAGGAIELGGAGAGGGTNEPSAGGAGEGGAAGSGAALCDDPKQQVVAVSEDTWIDAAEQTVTHGSDQQLWVEPGPTERRTLLLVDLPPALPGAWLIKGTVVLHLMSNADASLGERRFGLYRLTKQFVESKATWLKFSNGNNDWAAAGGDFSDLIAGATLPAGSTSGPLTFDVTKSLAAAYASQPVPVGLIMLEVGSPPSGPAGLAFASAEGDASGPSLVIEYCQP